ncbi:acyl--CoA ligase [Myxococcota bacterium]|nr:acyl--CoA ligase [Myxococcota bacterium]
MAFPDYEPTIPTFLHHVSEEFGDSPLVVLNGERITYRDSERKSAKLAQSLLAAGIGKGSRVGILMPNGPDFAVAFFAASRIGALVVPINTFFKAPEMAYVLRHADVDTLLMWPELLGNDYVERLEQCAPSLAKLDTPEIFVPELPYIRRVVIWGNSSPAWAQTLETFEAESSQNGTVDETFLEIVEACVSPADAATVIYSSGSTADPKGAVHTQGTLMRHSFNLNSFRDLQPSDRVFSPMPFFWVGGLVFTLLSTMHTGAFMICEEAFEAGETLALLEGERATIVAGWPHYTSAMVDHPTFAQRDLSSVRKGNLYELLPEEARPTDPELRSNSLGMTETCGPHSIDQMDYDLPEHLRGSFGPGVPGLEHMIADPETGDPLPVGEYGEICVRGYSLMQGLYKREREETFDANGFYHTGDGGYLNDEGHLFFKARLGEMVKTAGANVTPREIEIVLDSYPEIQGAYVVGVPDPNRGQNVVAALILNQGETLDAESLRKRLKNELAAYKVPRQFFFFEKESLPFTDSGKIDKRKLTQLLTEQGSGESQSV